MKTSTSEWITAAKDDLKAATLLLGNESLTHIAAFHCQQCIEKALKAVIEEHDLGLTKIHSLATLNERVSTATSLHIADEDTLDVLDMLYIDARYPGSLGLLPDGRPGLSATTKMLDFAKECLTRIEEFLRKDAPPAEPPKPYAERP